MSIISLPEFKKRTRDSLIAGIIEDIYTVNPLWQVVPWLSFAGSGLSVNREQSLGNAQFLGMGDTITAKEGSTVDQFYFEPTTIIGDAEINSLQAVLSASDINDVVTMEVSSKAKSIARMMQDGLVNGDGVAPNMNGLISMVDSEQIITPAANTTLDFGLLDQLQLLVLSKDGMVDWLQMHSRELIAYRELCRTLGGVPMVEVKVGESSIVVESYNGIPIYRNDYISPAPGEEANGNVIYAGVWDDGSYKVGAGMIYPAATTAGITFEDIGNAETADQKIYRIKAYCNAAIFNRRGIAMLKNIGPAVTFAASRLGLSKKNAAKRAAGIKKAQAQAAAEKDAK